MSGVEPVTVIGNLEETVCANNLDDTLRKIKSIYKNPFTVVIDSAISSKQNIGKITVANQGMYLGSGLNKKINCVGDMSIKGIVSENLNVPKYNFRLLQNTPLSLVMTMADIVASGIYNTINI